MSTAGTDLMPATPAPAPAAAAATTSAADAAALAEMKARVDALEKRVVAAEGTKDDADKDAWWHRVHLSGYVQPQIVWQTNNAAGSPNATNGALPTGISSNQVVATSNGATTNPDFFRLRRARLLTEIAPSDAARVIFEIDPTPPGGPGTGSRTIAREVEAQGITRFGKDAEIVWGGGIFRVPFGFEVQQSDADRPFIEMSWGEQNMLPGEYDTGAKAYGSFFDKRLQVNLAILNGVTEGERAFTLLPDLNHSKDFVARANWNFGPGDIGVSGYVGEGQAVDPAALRFKNFRRDAFNLEGALHKELLPSLGMTRAYAELVLGTNMDRGTKYGFAVPTIPTVISDSVVSLNEQSVWVRVEQDLGHWVTAGLRYDFYTPDTKTKNDGRDTYAAVAAVHFTKGLQLMAELDYAIDNVHRPDLEAPSRHILTGSGVLQARF